MENETDVAAFKDYQPPSELEGTCTATDTTSIQEEPPTMTPPSASTFQTAASAKYVPVSSSPQPTDKVLGSPYARKLAAEMGINLKVIN